MFKGTCSNLGFRIEETRPKAKKMDKEIAKTQGTDEMVKILFQSAQ